MDIVLYSATMQTRVALVGVIHNDTVVSNDATKTTVVFVSSTRLTPLQRARVGGPHAAHPRAGVKPHN